MFQNSNQFPINNKKTFSSNRTYYNFKKQNNKINNINKDSLKNIQINHKYDLICFQKCSIWELNLSKLDSKNKKSFSNDLIGGINEKNIKTFFTKENFNIQNELSSYFPIDMGANQRFALDKNIIKIPLLISFDLNDEILRKKNEFFIKINPEYSNTIFEIELNGFLEHYKRNRILKDNVKFQVKGFDIMKSIHNKINSLKMDKIYKMKGDELYYENYIFNNIQCSIGVGFIISKNNIIKNINARSFSIFEDNVKITKLFLNYSLPITVFTKQIQIQNSYNKNNNNNNYNNYNNNNNYNNYIITPIQNFCNFHSFMTNTTPFIYESDDLKVIDILESLNQASLFGINCLFKIDFKTFTNIRYFPKLNSLSINTLNNNTSFTSNNTTLDGSFLSNKSSFIKKTDIFFRENVKEIYNMKCYNEQIRNIKKNYSEIEELELNDIGYDSYFSIIWTPIKSFSNPKYNCIEYNNLNSLSFEIIYKFKTGNNTGHFMEVCGIQEKDIKGNDTNCNFFSCDDYFWFTNKSYNPISMKNNYNITLLQQQMFLFNKNYFCLLKNNFNFF